MQKILLILCIVLFSVSTEMIAGNPDRQGESGAYELLMNPWARSAGLHSMNTSGVYGPDAMRLNPAGIARARKSIIQVSYSRYLLNTDINLSAGGFTLPIGKDGNTTIGVSMNAVNFGDIPYQTEDNPDPTNRTFSPSFFNLGLGLGHMFENKVSVGILLRLVSESISDASAFAFAIDAGVQYTAGEKDNFKLGISLRNIGSDITFYGEGLAVRVVQGGTEITYSERALSSPLPSVLNIGASYDFYIGETNVVTVGGNFTANSFSRDEIGGYVQYGFNKKFFARGGYKAKLGDLSETGGDDLYSGLSLGAGMEVPLSKYNDNTFIVDYAFRMTNALGNTHNFGIGISF